LNYNNNINYTIKHIKEMSDLLDNKIIVSVEGNIGVGKSTFINLLKSKWENGCEVVAEPVDMWKKLANSDGKNILQTFYEDIPRWAYSFQNVACITRMMKIEDAIRTTNHKYIFLDRSLGTDKNVFEAMLHDDGKLNQIEHSMYNLWCDFYHKYVRPQDNQIYIYLKASPNTCANRIKKRGRIEEESIGLEYLEGLNKYHDDWLLSDKLKSNVIVIDCEEEFENDQEKQTQMIEQIKFHIEQFFSHNENIISKLKYECESESDSKSKSTHKNKILIENL
jgi:thymidine kinase